MNVALLGGSFNPPHMGHALCASFARTALGADEVWLLPAFHHPLGKPLEAFEHRLEMCHLLAKQLGDWARGLDTEAHLKGEGRTVDLLEHLVPLYPGWQFQWLMGSDTVADLPLWKGFARIQELVKVVVIHRLGYPQKQAIGPGLISLSSTEVRQRLEAQDIPEGWLPTSIADYVRRHRLYGQASYSAAAHSAAAHSVAAHSAAAHSASSSPLDDSCVSPPSPPKPHT